MLHRDRLGRPTFRPGIINYLDDLTDGGGVGAQGGPGFDGPSSNQVYPPDPAIGVGPSNILLATNAGFRVYDKAGNAQTPLTAYLAFFQSSAGYDYAGEPQVCYSAQAGRWFLSANAWRLSDYHSWYLLGVSQTADPSGTWKTWALDSSLNGSTDSGCFSSYPKESYDGKAVYISSDMFSRTTYLYGYSKIRVIPGAQVLSFNNTLTYTDLFNITNPDGSVAGPCAPVVREPVSLADLNNDFLAQGYGNSEPPKTVNFFGVIDPLGTPTLQKCPATLPNGATYSDAPLATQLGGAPNLATGDVRPQRSLILPNGHLFTAWTTANNGYAAFQWSDWDVSQFPGSVNNVQFGTIGPSNTHAWDPSLAIDKWGNIGTVNYTSSSTQHPAIVYEYRRPDDPPGALSSPWALKTSAIHYAGEGFDPVNWGNFTAAATDPADGTTLWLYGQYASSLDTHTWGTWVSQYTIPAHTATLSGNVALELYKGGAGIQSQIDVRWPGSTTAIFSGPIALDGTGNYSLSGVPVGTWDLSLKYPNWLRQTLKSVTVTSTTPPIDFSQLNGDANNANHIGISAISTVLANFGNKGVPGGPGDLNWDGSVGIADLSPTLLNFNLSGDP